MFVILCHPGDAAALWLHAELLRLGQTAELVAVEQLVYSRGIVHRLDGTGDAGEIRLADGRTLRVEAIRTLVNRVATLPQAHFAHVGEADRAYAVEELGAFLLAWLDAVPGRVLNPARPNALGGSWMPVPAMMHLAAAAGLPAGAWRADSLDGAPLTSPSARPAEASVVVLDHRVYGRVLSGALQDGCRRLAALSGMPLLQVDFARAADGGLDFLSAHGFADFRIGGRALVRAIARTHGERAA